MGLVTDPRTDRSRLVGHAYKTSAPFLARTGLYRYQRDGVDIRRWVIDQIAWPADAPRARRRMRSRAVPGEARRARPRRPRDRHGPLGRHGRGGERVRALSSSATRKRFPFGDAQFDVVIAAHMLYHVPDVDTAVQEFARVLKPNAYALVVLNGKDHLREMRRLIGASLRDLVGTDYIVPAREHRTLHDRDREPDPGACVRRRAVRAAQARGRAPRRATRDRLRRQHAFVLRTVAPLRHHVEPADGPGPRAGGGRGRDRRGLAHPERRRLLRLSRPLTGRRTRGESFQVGAPGLEPGARRASGSLARSSARRNARIASKSGSSGERVE